MTEEIRSINEIRRLELKQLKWLDSLPVIIDIDAEGKPVVSRELDETKDQIESKIKEFESGK